MPEHLNDAATTLRAAANSIPVEAVQEAHEHLATIAGDLQQVGGNLANALTSTAWARVREAEAITAKLAQLRQELLDTANRIGSGQAVHSPSTAGAAAPKPRANVRHQDGSEYPTNASWAVPTLPPRVGTGGQTATVGRIKIGSTEISGEFRSDQGDRWAGAAGQRMADLGIRGPSYLRFHVEMRTVAMMIDSRAPEASVCINNVPCGYQTRPIGCHQVLNDFLPEGYRLTVYGTDRNGKPFQRTYGRS